MYEIGGGPMKKQRFLMKGEVAKKGAWSVSYFARRNNFSSRICGKFDFWFTRPGKTEAAELR